MARHFSYRFNIDSACPGIAFTNAIAFYTTTIILVARYNHSGYFPLKNTLIRVLLMVSTENGESLNE